MGRLGLSIDWSNEYVTMKPEYYVKTQTSFVRMYENGQIYRENHPVNWCPRCGTAIAFAEVEYDSRTTTLNYMRFSARRRRDARSPPLGPSFCLPAWP